MVSGLDGQGSFFECLLFVADVHVQHDVVAREKAADDVHDRLGTERVPTGAVSAIRPRVPLRSAIQDHWPLSPVGVCSLRGADASTGVALRRVFRSARRLRCLSTNTATISNGPARRK